MDGYPSLHVSPSNPEGPTSTDLPLLLHRVADMIEELGLTHDEILDLVISGEEITEYGSWWKATLYWSPRLRLVAADTDAADVTSDQSPVLTVT